MMNTPDPGTSENATQTSSSSPGEQRPDGYGAQPAGQRESQRSGGAHGRGLMDQVRDAAYERLDAQKTRAVSGLTALADTMRQSGRQMGGENAVAARYVETAADQVERFVGGLRDRDLRTATADRERFARRRPAMFLGGAFALGLLAARFLKSSSESEQPSASMRTDRRRTYGQNA
jgi:hypothetical protein